MVSCESEIPSYPCRNVRSRGRDPHVGFFGDV